VVEREAGQQLASNSRGMDKEIVGQGRDQALCRHPGSFTRRLRRAKYQHFCVSQTLFSLLCCCHQRWVL